MADNWLNSIASSCKSSVGRYSWHSKMNNILGNRASANCSLERIAQLPRSGGSGKRADGITSYDWKRDRQHVWGYICASTLTDMYLDRNLDNQISVFAFCFQRRNERLRLYIRTSL